MKLKGVTACHTVCAVRGKAGQQTQLQGAAEGSKRHWLALEEESIILRCNKREGGVNSLTKGALHQVWFVAYPRPVTPHPPIHLSLHIHTHCTSGVSIIIHNWILIHLSLQNPHIVHKASSADKRAMVQAPFSSYQLPHSWLFHTILQLSGPQHPKSPKGKVCSAIRMSTEASGVQPS